MPSRRIFLTVSMALLLLTAAARAGDEKPAPWKVSGQLEEACSCDAACPSGSVRADPFRKEYMQGRTTRQTYNDAGQK